MKLYLLILFLFTPFLGKSQAIDQEIINCQYKLTYLPDSLKPTVNKEDFMILEIGKKTSKFYSYNTFRVDSLIQNDTKNGMSPLEMLANRNKYGKKGFLYTIYTNYPDNKITMVEKLLSDTYQYEEPKGIQVWKILSETKNMLGYEVQKATCTFGGRNYIAWFASDIPTSFGPYKFNGLPGLIMQIEDSKNQYNFTCVGIKKINGNAINKPANAQGNINLSKKDFFKIFEQYSTEPLAFIQNHTPASISMKSGNSTTKKPYNPIELIP